MFRFFGVCSIFFGAFRLWCLKHRIKPYSSAFFEYRKTWNQAIARAFKFNIQIYHPAPPIQSGTLIVANHLGFADINMLLCTLPADCKPLFISKTSVGNIPIFGWHMRHFGDILLDRKDPNARKTVITQAVSYLQSGLSVVLFPEGTRSKTGRPQTNIKTALIDAAIAAKIPILPVAVKDTAYLIEQPWRIHRNQTISIHYSDKSMNFIQACEVWDKVQQLFAFMENYAQ